MRNLCMIVSYEGTHYHGFQIQPNKVTVQQKIQEAIHVLTGEETIIHASGRTDAGVHARAQVFHFHTSSPIKLQQWTLAINARLPKDIVVQNTFEVPESFHARRSAKSKTYRYTIRNDRLPDVFRRNLQLHVPVKLNWQAIEQALQHLIGRHDFTTFASTKTDKASLVRTIYRAWIEEDPHDPAVKHLYFKGDGFLTHMIRIIIGTLLQVGRGKRSSDDIPTILLGKNRALAGPTAPAHGLMLWEVEYDEIPPYGSIVSR